MKSLRAVESRYIHENVGVGRSHTRVHGLHYDFQIMFFKEAVHGEFKLRYMEQKWCAIFMRFGRVS